MKKNLEDWRGERVNTSEGFPLWDLLCWYRLTYSLKLKIPRKIEDELFKAAKQFVPCRAKGDCFDAPYGQYIWHSCVQILHFQVTDSPEFVEGFNYWEHQEPYPWVNWKGRGGNPYRYGGLDLFKHLAWDAGYIVGMHLDESGTAFSRISKASETLWIYGS